VEKARLIFIKLYSRMRRASSRHFSQNRVGSETMGRRLRGRANLLGQATLDIDFQAMSLDELWSLHEQICSLLAAKAEAGNRELEERLNTLERRRVFLKRGLLAAGLAQALSSSPLFASVEIAEDVLMFAQAFF